jgi:DeoR family transcriptional regulator of aga operon
MRRTERLNAIMERLARDGSVAVTALSRGFGVSEASVRRDLSLLESQQWLSRTHGGAVARGPAAEVSRAWQAASDRQAYAFRIAQTAAERVRDCARIGVTGGPLATALGRALNQHAGLTVVTNALQVAYELSLRPDIRVVVPGGVSSGPASILGGPLTDMALRELRLDLVLVGADGASADAGLTADDEAVAYAARSFIATAPRAIAVVDTPAIGRSAFTRICGLDGVEELITGEDVDPDAVGALAATGLRVTSG